MSSYKLGDVEVTIPNILGRVETAPLGDIIAWAQNPGIDHGTLGSQVMQRLAREAERLTAIEEEHECCVAEDEAWAEKWKERAEVAEGKLQALRDRLHEKGERWKVQAKSFGESADCAPPDSLDHLLCRLKANILTGCAQDIALLTAPTGRQQQKAPLPPEVLVDALQDRPVTSGRTRHAKAVKVGVATPGQEPKA